MARTGIYKSEVLRARDKLLALGRYPSIDSVRQELGNTGSKATIHRYLKEIEEEEGGMPGSKVVIGDALQDLVARLSERLRLEADARIEELTIQHAHELAEQRQAHEKTQGEAAELRKALEKTQGELVEEQARQQRTANRLHQAVTAHATVTQQVSDLGDRLRAEAEHRQSLEEKHTHAREALEHFRTASKEQREQDQRQHEQQVQYLQGEIKSLRNSLVHAQHEAASSKEVSARLASDLAQSERSLSEVKAELQQLRHAKSELASANQQVEKLGRQVVTLQAQVDQLQTLKAELETEQSSSQDIIHQLQVDLAAARASLDTQNQLTEKIQLWMTQKPESFVQAPAPKR